VGLTHAPVAHQATTADGAPASRAIGILGGTFDPVHVGHLAVADVALGALDLDRVVLMPAGLPPHKLDRPITDAAHREAMLRLAIAGRPGLEVSRLELERPGPSYAVDTLAHVADVSTAEGRPAPWFILSGEALAGFPDWRDPDRILELGRIAVAPRPGAAVPDAAWLEATFPGRADRFAFLPGPRVAVSATDIRRRVLEGRPIDGLVPPSVERYIMEHDLYQEAGDRPAEPERSSA
jgi:nicotinate-nucleotide adenylyltransferase